MLPISRIGIIHLTWSRQLQRQLLPHGLSIKQLHVLQELLRQEVLNPSAIADMLFCDRPTATVVIRNLEKKGWIKKERDPLNGRQFQVVITSAGRTKVEQILASGFDGNRGLRLEEALNGEEVRQLDRLLQKVQGFLKDRC